MVRLQLPAPPAKLPVFSRDRDVEMYRLPTASGTLTARPSCEMLSSEEIPSVSRTWTVRNRCCSVAGSLR
jgi:hypothetical protein